jgi:hypothetical protein
MRIPVADMADIFASSESGGAEFAAAVRAGRSSNAALLHLARRKNQKALRDYVRSGDSASIGPMHTNSNLVKPTRPLRRYKLLYRKGARLTLAKDFAFGDAIECVSHRKNANAANLWKIGRNLRVVRMNA